MAWMDSCESWASSGPVWLQGSSWHFPSSVEYVAFPPPSSSAWPPSVRRVTTVSWPPVRGFLHKNIFSARNIFKTQYFQLFLCPSLPYGKRAERSVGHHHQVPALPPAQSSGARVSLRLPGGSRLSRPLRSGSCLHLPLQLHHRLSPRSLFKLAEVSARGLGKIVEWTSLQY